MYGRSPSPSRRRRPERGVAYATATIGAQSEGQATGAARPLLFLSCQLLEQLPEISPPPSLTNDTCKRYIVRVKRRVYRMRHHHWKFGQPSWGPEDRGSRGHRGRHTSPDAHDETCE